MDNKTTKPWTTKENQNKTMDNKGKPWTTKEKHGQQKKSMDNKRKPWITKENHGQQNKSYEIVKLIIIINYLEIS